MRLKGGHIDAPVYDVSGHATVFLRHPSGKTAASLSLQIGQEEEVQKLVAQLQWWLSDESRARRAKASQLEIVE